MNHNFGWILKVLGWQESLFWKTITIWNIVSCGTFILYWQVVNIIKLHCTLSSRLLGQYYQQVKKKKTNKQTKEGLRYFMDYSLLADACLEICFHNRQCNIKEPSSSMSSSPSIIWRLKVNKCCLFEKIIYG